MSTHTEPSPSDRPAPDSGAVTEEAQPVDDPTAASHSHPKELEYVEVALFLAFITAIEVTVYYIKSIRGILVPVLLVAGFVKFVTVALEFMHLRFDSRIFRRLFVLGLLLAIGVYMIVLTTFHVWST